jgi:hypothetical protein
MSIEGPIEAELMSIEVCTTMQTSNNFCEDHQIQFIFTSSVISLTLVVAMRRSDNNDYSE